MYILLAALFFTTLCSIIPEPLKKVLDEAEEDMRWISGNVTNIMQYGKCNVSCSCSYLGCYSVLLTDESFCSYKVGNNTDCPVGAGRYIHLGKSILRVAGLDIDDLDEVDEAKKIDECWTQSIEPTLMDTFNLRNNITEENEIDPSILYSNTYLTWILFGTANGVLRRYPGTAIKTCDDYDPRVRPWYVGATTGPKDVIIVMDRSGSMGGYNRLTYAKQACKTVIQTLGLADYAAVISFSNNATLEGGFSPEMKD